MKAVLLLSRSVDVKLETGLDVCDITSRLDRLIEESNIENGSMHATMVGSTGSITTLEFEPGVVEDLKRAIHTLAPPGAEYEHEKAWHDGNGHSHVQDGIARSFHCFAG